ncbi:bifunctional helix-turn-helix transcriptional regulator/GNAT family N-acetyltransferase [Isoptericola sediminis]|uniref:MarR family transcriptional regulator/GNAT family N-acetyltransferase n=1 Tax=Isoptericola sediminis TaxID=2733572 RepID=A0A849K4G5_9MICO|nr:GNAT family N-acetyltransferase [Isoptericola sediminis]NNU27290.1 MarR family transcriptional regulator/GNAT family N-acetyltransferase [Isoptericola sediminis]
MSVRGHVDVLRRFNRSYTQRVGVLEESFLGLGMALGTARLLYEIGAAPDTTRALRARLGLDREYLRRLLRRLQEEGLVSVAPDPEDPRRRRVTLTPAGRTAWEELDRRSDERARRFVDPLTARQRARLSAALGEADLLVRAATVELVMVAPDDPVARRAVLAFFAEVGERIGSTDAFDVDAALAADAERLVPPLGGFVVAASGGDPVACGGVQDLGDGVAEIKRMWVDTAWRGAGLGSRLLRRLEDLAVELGHREVVLDTNGVLGEAVVMYEEAGYRQVERFNDDPYATHFFAKDLTT